ncbi:MAG: ankyrin repeat domain-containing protein [Polyangiaceae bacterium]
MSPALLEQVERLYMLAKSDKWQNVWLALAGERELAAACGRYAKPSSGWTFLHQAAHAGHEGSIRALIRLGASLSLKSNEGETAADVARRRGHGELARLMQRAAESAGGLWDPPRDPDLLPSSSAWAEASERRASRELRVAYGGGSVTIPAGGRYYVDSFERAVIGWHGTYDPPSGMDGESMV